MPSQTDQNFVRYERRPLLLLASAAGLVKAERLFNYAYVQSGILKSRLQELSKRKDYLEAEVACLEFQGMGIGMWNEEAEDYQASGLDREKQIEENKRFLDECGVQELEIKKEIDRHREQKNKAENTGKLTILNAGNMGIQLQYLFCQKP